MIRERFLPNYYPVEPRTPPAQIELKLIQGKEFTYLADSEIKKMLNIKRPLIDWVFNRICAFTNDIGARTRRRPETIKPFYGSAKPNLFQTNSFYKLR